jgi:type IV secretory pathway component VirB8
MILSILLMLILAVNIFFQVSKQTVHYFIKTKKNDNHVATKQRLVDLISYALYQLQDSCIKLSLTDSFLSEVQYVNN